MRKFLSIFAIMAVLVLAACGNDNGETVEEDGANGEEESKGTITFGQTGWSSTAVPTEIVKQMLEEVGYEVEVSLLDQPVIFEGLKEREVDFFMDAWLPHTEASLWAAYEDELTIVAESYAEAAIGWVVPSYVEENSIEDIKQNPEKFNNTVYTIDAGAGVANLAEEVVVEYGLEDMFEVSFSSEGAMLGELYARIQQEEPVIITGWRPHSMFTQFDLKFLEEPKDVYKYDNIYVISYDGIEETHPEAYEILSNWSIEIDELEEMMYENEENGVSFEDLATEWIEENRDRVDEMLGK